ncbi:MAG: hypothetical protein ACPLRS_05185, partial [Hydrogenobacter sp.]
MKESLKLLFLIVAYNFILEYISEKLPIKLFPDDLQSFVMLMSFDSALYLAWLFGYRYSTLAWLSYLFFFQILGLSLITQTFDYITRFTPSFLITLIFLSLFESPTERHTKELLEEKKRLESELERNRRELENIKEQVRLAEDLVNLLRREKEQVEAKLSQLEESQITEKEELLKEREELIQRINQAQIHLNEYRNRLERLTEANRKLFELIDLLQRQEDKNQKGEIAQLRKERKKLVKELLQLESLLEEYSKENTELKLELSKTRSQLEDMSHKKELLELELQELKKQINTKGEIYREILNVFLENIEMEDRAISEFMHLPVEKKREFIKELLILNMKEEGEPLESMKGLKNVFKLKPRGGRIYFTFGEKRRWKVLGLIDSEDNKDKEKYAKEILIK